LNYSIKYKREEILPIFYEANTTLIPKLDKDMTQKENYRLISLMNINAKIITKYFQIKLNNPVKRLHSMIKLVSIQ
jgi:hypothetical protein